MCRLGVKVRILFSSSQLNRRPSITNNQTLTTDEAAVCMSLLQRCEAPITAVQIAEVMHLGGMRETQRRHVRKIVQHLRDNCSARIVATLQGGYCLTDDDTLWRDYLEGRLIDAKRIFGNTHNKKRISGQDGQGLLFAPPTGCGIG